MSLTVASIEAELIGKFGPKLALVGMDATTQSGTNSSLDPSIRRAVNSLGVSTASPLAVVDADLATIQGFSVEKLVDLASLDLLGVVLSRCNLFDVAVDIDQQKLSQLREGIEAAVAFYADRIAKPYGPTMPATLVGRMEKGRHIPNDPYRRIGWLRNWITWPYPPDRCEP